MRLCVLSDLGRARMNSTSGLLSRRSTAAPVLSSFDSVSMISLSYRGPR